MGKAIKVSIIVDYPEFVKDFSSSNSFSIHDKIEKKTPILWVCQGCGSDFPMNLRDRDRGRGKDGCRNCTNIAKGMRYKQRLLDNGRSFAEIFPEKLKYLTNENKIDPKTIVASTEKALLSFKCEKGHEFERTPRYVYLGKWCPTCAKAARTNGVKKALELKTEDIERLPREIKLNWSKENEYSFEDLKHRTSYFFIDCEKCKTAYRTNISKYLGGRGCPYCKNVIFKSGVNSLDVRRPDIDRLLSSNHKTPSRDIPSWTKELLLLECPDCKHEWETFTWNIIKCRKCFPRSTQEYELSELFSDWGYEFQVDTRRIIPPKELDFFFHNENLAIEFNGDYWHSDGFIKSKTGVNAFDYHKEKFDLCLDLGITLAFVWESDLKENTEECLIALKNFLETGELASILSKFDNSK